MNTRKVRKQPIIIADRRSPMLDPLSAHVLYPHPIEQRKKEQDRNQCQGIEMMRKLTVYIGQLGWG